MRQAVLTCELKMLQCEDIMMSHVKWTFLQIAD